MNSVWHFLKNIFSVSVEIPLCSSIVLLTLVNIFLMVTSNYLSGKSCISVSLGSVSGDLSSLFETYLLVSSSLLTLCVGDCVLEKAATSGSLCKMASYIQRPPPVSHAREIC